LVGGVCVPGREERADLLNYFIDSPFVVAKLAPYVEKILVLGHRAHSHDQNFHRRNYENRRWDRFGITTGMLKSAASGAAVRTRITRYF
jgi:hypothetical protein